METIYLEFSNVSIGRIKYINLRLACKSDSHEVTKIVLWFYLIINIMIYFLTSHMLVGDFGRGVNAGDT